MFADDGIFSAPQQSFQCRLSGGSDPAGKAAEEQVRFADRPASVDANQNIVAVFGERLFELVYFEALNPFVELMDHLNRWRPFPVESGLSNKTGRAIKCRHDRYFSLPHLKTEQQQNENRDQQRANEQGECISFHRKKSTTTSWVEAPGDSRSGPGAHGLRDSTSTRHPHLWR